jgi:hypothetical protein
MRSKEEGYPSVNELKSISAVKPKRESGSSRMKRKRGGENVGFPLA